MNTVAEIGRLTKDVELKQTTGGKTYGRFTPSSKQTIQE